jgi:S1-C subfamily serine protease
VGAVSEVSEDERQATEDQNQSDSSWTQPSLDMLFQLYKVCMARVTVRNEHGDLGNGAAFHIGDGYLVTARHVMEDGEVVTIEPEHRASPEKFIVARTFVPDDPRIDLAILETDFSLQHYMEKVTIMWATTRSRRSTSFPLADI